MKLKPMSEAPKDVQILLDVGLPYFVCGHWNEHQKEWVIAQLHCNMMNGEFTDHYFENEYELEPRGWLPIPCVAEIE